jgi:hypothetical protein
MRAILLESLPNKIAMPPGQLQPDRHGLGTLPAGSNNVTSSVKNLEARERARADLSSRRRLMDRWIGTRRYH